MHEVLTVEQRARLEIITTLIDDSTTRVSGPDLLRYAQWVDLGDKPGPDAAVWSAQS